VVGSILAKAATALILLDWHRGSLTRMAITAAVAWSAVHAYTGTIFVVLSIFVALLIEPCLRRDWRSIRRRGLVIAGIVAALQVPYAIHQLSNRFSDRAMGAVTRSLTAVVSGNENVRLAGSAEYYVQALTSIQGDPWPAMASAWLLLGCGVIVAVWHRRDPVLLAVTLLPQAGAIVGYALWLGDLDSYYYLSLMPAAVLTVLLAATAPVPRRIAHAIGIALLIGVLAIAPARVQAAARLFRMPEYQVLVVGSREIIKRKQPMQSIRTTVKLPATSNPEFLFRVLGGRIDRRAEWRAVISPDGRVDYFR
jgi:hypothetical protein